MCTMTSIPKELRSRAQWVLWRMETRDGKDTKVPYQIDGRKADSTLPETWSTYDTVTEALAAHPDEFSGVGFVFAADDPYCGVDLDNCTNGDGEPLPKASAWIRLLAGYTERTPSGRGFHVIVQGKKPGTRCATGWKWTDSIQGKVEVYEANRFFTFTGMTYTLSADPIPGRQAALEAFYREVFPEKATNGTGEKRSHHVTVSDDDLIAIASRASNGAKFSRLWQGDTTGYGSQSEADLALVSLLAFYSGRDGREQIDRLFRRSGLFREKWDQSSGEGTCGERTIDTALSTMTTFYSGKAATASAWILGGAQITIASWRRTPSKLHVSVNVEQDGVQYPFGITSSETAIDQTTKRLAEFTKEKDRALVGRTVREILRRAEERSRAPRDGKTMREVLFDIAEKRYAFRYRTEKGSAWSETYGRFIWRKDFKEELLDFDDLDALRKASDCPPDLDDAGLSRRAEQLAKTIWTAILRELPDQGAADLGAGSIAAGEMKAAITQAWLSPVGPGREALMVAAVAAATRAPGWRPAVSGLPAWCRKTQAGGFEFSMRWEAFRALGIPLVGIRDHASWQEAMRRYGLEATDGRAGEGRTRMVVLSADAMAALSACTAEER